LIFPTNHLNGAKASTFNQSEQLADTNKTKHN